MKLQAATNEQDYSFGTVPTNTFDMDYDDFENTYNNYMLVSYGLDSTPVNHKIQYVIFTLNFDDHLSVKPVIIVNKN